MATQEEYDQLSLYTLAHGGKNFIHQHVVDAIGAQEPLPNDKPIRLAFALIGLCQWCRSFWQAYAAEHDTIRSFIRSSTIARER